MLEQMMKMLEGQRINSYRLNKFLGAGGFGGVFHASEMVRNTSVQEVAIKVIPESSDDKLNGLFVTWYGSIGGHKLTKSLSGKRLN